MVVSQRSQFLIKDESGFFTLSLLFTVFEVLDINGSTITTVRTQFLYCTILSITFNLNVFFQ